MIGFSSPSYPAATQAEMEAGTEPGLRSVSPVLVKQAIDALGGGGSAPTPHDLGTVSGDVELTAAMGPLIFCNIDGNTVFQPMGSAGDTPRVHEVTLVVEFASSAGQTVNFGSWVGQPTLDNVTLPFEMTQAWRQAVFTLRFTALKWNLVRVEAFMDENTD